MTLQPVALGRTHRPGDDPGADPRPPDPRPVTLAAPPWPPLYVPYLATAVLSEDVSRRSPGRRVDQVHLYLRWYRVLRDTFGEDAHAIYWAVTDFLAFTDVPDFIFSRTVLGDGDPEPFVAGCLEHNADVVARNLDRLRDTADRFVADEAARLAGELPDDAVLGLSITFTQTLPALAIAKAVKALRPDVTVLFGGALMNPGRARVLVDNFDFVDVVCAGEGEATLVPVLEALDRGEVPGRVAGATSRQTVGTTVEPPLVDLSVSGEPHIDSYFDQIEESDLRDQIDFKLAWEISRGCWWGERRHCTFCGLNGTAMAHRRRPAAKLVDELVAQIRRTNVLDVIFVDNILHPDDIEQVFEQLPDDVDLRMHMDVKADLSFDQMRRLRDHGVWHLQPGLESLARRPLQLMRKGVTPFQNIRFLRSAEELGLTVTWNILLGFPGETDEDYDEMASQVHKLFHLQPPSAVARIAIVRNSPLFDDDELGIRSKRPLASTVDLWSGVLDDDEIRVMADAFEPTNDYPAISARVEEQLDESTTRWLASYQTTSLSEEVDGGRHVIRRSTGGGPPVTVVEFEEPWQRLVWQALRDGLTTSRRNRLFAEIDPATRARSVGFIDDLADLDVLYQDGGLTMALPVRYLDHVPTKLGLHGR